MRIDSGAHAQGNATRDDSEVGSDGHLLTLRQAVAGKRADL